MAGGSDRPRVGRPSRYSDVVRFHDSPDVAAVVAEMARAGNLSRSEVYRLVMRAGLEALGRKINERTSD
jgi:hypothetical protein